MASVRREAWEEQFTALPWALWAGVMALVVTSTTNVVVLVAVALGCWLTMYGVGGPRAVVSRVVGGLSLTLVAVWAVLGVLIHRAGLGGEVVWFLPAWSSETGGEFGGAVTLGQLHFAAARAAQAVAVVAVLGVLAQVVSAGGWLRLAAATWGRAARLWGPLLCLGEAYAAEHDARTRARRSGLDAGGPGATVVDVTDRARTLAEDWFAHHRPVRSGTRGLAVLAGPVGLMAVLALSVWWAVTAIDPGGWPTVSGMERTLLAAAVLAAFGIALHRGAVPGPEAGDVVPVVSAVVVAAAWFARDLTGDAGAVLVDFGRAPPLPVILLLSLAALPVLALAGGGRR
ncbi:hypothetical protein KVF89_25435 [Nocardioides carbamazepini]|uniref:hypothetical protein n=1 Tax=Nocardioides carbamazepini TaxID=2854259 RepID=UPI00214A00D8|nr:hypothetical protein [Nocardioides carbamazepini]MCR1785903.1 hypothetical protein [Nocardioides carbamazepini]